MLLQPLQGHAVAVFHVPILRTSSATTAFLWAPDPPAFAPRSTLAATGGNAASAAAVLRPPGTRWPPHHQKLLQGLLATPSSHPSRATPAQRARWCDGVVSPWEVYASRDNVALLQQILHRC